MNLCFKILITIVAITSINISHAQAHGTQDGFADIVERLSPAVVNISTSQTVRNKIRPMFPMFPKGHPFEQFDEHFSPFRGGNAPRIIERQAQSLGSGFVIDPSGYIVTNNHVIDGAEKIQVTFSDDSKHEAKVIGRDKKTDIAILKIEADEPLPYVEFGDSDNARVGDWVIVIGNPFGLGGSVTSGIISARARDINAGPFDDFIQTDAAINRGNSGGPMFNLKGEVVGISTAIFSPNGGGNVGIGFAVPSNMSKHVVDQLIKDGKVRRGWLGVRVQTITDEIADSIDLEEPNGALVAEVINGSPAEKAGIEVGDIIIRYNRSAVRNMKDLPRIVAAAPIGADVPMKVIRNGKIRIFQVNVDELREESGKAKKHVDSTQENGKRSAQNDNDIEVLGLSVAKITRKIRDELEIENSPGSVVITGVEKSSHAARIGIQKGDVIISVNQQKVSSPMDVKKHIEKSRDSGRKSVLVLLNRGGNLTLFVTLPIKK